MRVSHPARERKPPRRGCHYISYIFGLYRRSVLLTTTRRLPYTTEVTRGKVSSYRTKRKAARQMQASNMDALCSLLQTPFFHPCPTCSTGGSAQRDTTVNHFNLDNLNAGCSHCLPASGSGQRVLQVSNTHIAPANELAGCALSVVPRVFCAGEALRIGRLPPLRHLLRGCRSGGRAITVRCGPDRRPLRRPWREYI